MLVALFSLAIENFYHFPNCSNIMHDELSYEVKFAEITIAAGACRELSDYSFIIASESDFVVDFYKITEEDGPPKVITTKKNPFIINNPTGDSEFRFTSTIKCADSSKECKV